MLLVTSAVKTLLSISQNGINQITLNKQLGNHLSMDIINASISLSSFPFSGCFLVLRVPVPLVLGHFVNSPF
jgi:hypothetical protein